LRQGSGSAKSRGEVRGGGRKPWKQKGTGKARAGSIRSPIWVGGGKAHPPRARDFSIKLNKKVDFVFFKIVIVASISYDYLFVEKNLNCFVSRRLKCLLCAVHCLLNWHKENYLFGIPW
jgi:large subunit ribosomal protein L4